MTDLALGALAFHAETRRLLTDGDVVRVRAVAGDYVRAGEAAGPPPGFREAFETGIDTLIQRSFAVSVAGDGARRLGDRGLARAVVADGAMPMQRPWAISIHPTKCAEASLRGGCQELIVVQSIGRFIFVRRIDVRSDPAVLISCAVLRTRTRSDLADVVVRGDRVMAVGDFGAALALEIEDSRVLAWRNAEAPETGPIPNLRLPWVVTSTAFAADLSQVWTVENPLRRGPRLRVLSAETLRTTVHEERVLSAQATVHSVPRAFPCPASAQDAAPKSHAMAFVGNPAGTVDFRTGDGQPLSKARLAAAVQPRSVAPFPGGGLFGLIDAEDADAFQVVRMVPTSVVIASSPIAGRADDAVGAVADENGTLIFVLFEEDERERKILALDARDPTHVTRLYGVRVPYRTALTRDQATGTAALRIVLPTGLHVIPLGAEPPEIPADPEPFSMLRVPFCQMLGIRCQRPASPRRHVLEARLHLIGNPSKARRMVDEAIARGDTDAVYDIACVFELHDDYARAAEMNASVVDRFPRNPWLALQAARLLANVGLWPRVLIALDGVSDSAFDGPDARHFAHLLGFALMAAGRHDEAVDVLERGLSHQGPCALQVLLAVASRPEKTLDVGPDARALRELARRVTEADRCLAAANPRGALDHVDHVLVWEARELQSGARLARAMLSAGEDGPPDHRLRKLLALATFVEVHEEKTGRQREVLLRDRWNGHDLAALAKEAHAWIESFFELEEHPSWRLVPSNGE